MLWEMKTRADTTDENTNRPSHSPFAEETEEESPTEDEHVTHDSPGGPRALLENMRVDQGIAITNGWHNDASNIQQAMMILLESDSHDAAGGLQADALNRIRNVFQRLFRFHRNRGSDERAQRYRAYVEDIASLMR